MKIKNLWENKRKKGGRGRDEILLRQITIHTKNVNVSEWITHQSAYPHIFHHSLSSFSPHHKAKMPHNMQTCRQMAKHSVKRSSYGTSAHQITGPGKIVVLPYSLAYTSAGVLTLV